MLRGGVMVLGHKLFDSEATSWNRKTAERKFVFCWQSGRTLASRIEWCQRQKTQARTQLEREGWQAEEEGLLDVLLNRVHTNQYQHCPPGVFKRYVIGLQDGEALMRTAPVDQYSQSLK